MFGAGRPYFGAMGPGDTVMLANPSRVVQGDRVMHLLYDVVSTTPREPRRENGTAASAPGKQE
jgi:hypothetical protein